MNKEFLTELIAELKEFKREKEAEGLIPTVELMIEEMTERLINNDLEVMQQQALMSKIQ